MNKQGPKGIEWTDYTWSPISGCRHSCGYCYARRMATRFEGKAFPNGFMPTFYPERLTEPAKVKRPSKIFVGSMGDLFGDWDWANATGYHRVDGDRVIEEVLQIVRECPQHTFQFLTKNPKRYQGIDFPANAWVGTSVENQAAAEQRIPILLQATAKVRFVSVEPLLGPVDLSNWINAAWWAEQEQVTIRDGLTGRVIGTRPGHTGWHHVSKGKYDLSWVIIGGETGPGAKPVNPEWADSLIQQLRAANVPTFLKDNLHLAEQIREFPLA